MASRNILVGEGKQLKISDFGMARATIDEVSHSSSNKNGLMYRSIYILLYISFPACVSYTHTHTHIGVCQVNQGSVTVEMDGNGVNYDSRVYKFI